MSLEKYEWVKSEPGPKMLLEALRLYGTQEKAGDADNPVILEWAKELGFRSYTADSIPWCGLFAAIVAKRAGKALPARPLWARDWATWGVRSHQPMLGDMLVFERGSGGHVGLYICEDATHYHVLGGNQNDAVNIKRIAKDRLLAARRQYKQGAPENIRPITCCGGELSKTEA